MKKLIAMIGAVAMAFGLYAEGTPADNYYANSFETATEGVTGETWTPPADWTTTQTEAFTLGAQDQTGLPYATGRARRTALFEAKETNDNYLKLETGTNTLVHGVGTDQVYFDQLVKFTGYEEDPTIAAGSKIAVWLSAIDTEDYVPAELDETGAEITPASGTLGATNLFVTVGKGDGTKVNVQIDGDFEVDKWYRVTIKSIGEVNTAPAYSQLGFQLFIDGQAASIVGAEKYNDNSSTFTDTAKALYAKGQLFTAIPMEDLTLATVAYQGIGGVDDIIFSQEAPDFDSKVEFTVGAVPGVVLVKVEDAEGVQLTAPYMVMPNSQVKIYVKAADGYRIDNLPEGYITKTISAAGEVSIADDLAGKVVKGVVQVVNADGTVTNLYAAAELGTVLKGLKTGDTATVLENCAITQGEEEEMVTLFSFTANTTIAVPEANVWNVFIANVDEETAGALYDNVGLLAGKTVSVDFADAIDEYNACELYLSGEIAGDITATVKGNVILADNDVSTLSGTITAANVEVNYDVTLVDNGKLITQNDEIFEIVDGKGDIVDPVAGPEEGWFTYQIKQATGFAIIIADGDPVYYDTLEEAINDAMGVENAKVVILQDCEIASTITVTDDLSIELAEGVTVDTTAADQKAFLVINDATLSVKGVTADDDTVTVFNGRFTVGKRVSGGHGIPGNLVIDGGSYAVTGEQTVIHVNGDCQGAFNDECSVSIKNATITSAVDNAIQFNGKGTYAIENSKVTGYTGIYLKAGTLTIDGTSEIVANGAKLAPSYHSGGSNKTGDAIVLDSVSGYKGEVSLDLAEGAKVTSENGYAVIETITKGETSTTLRIADNGATLVGKLGGLSVTDEFNGEIIGYVAEVGGVCYKTLQAAVAAAGEGATVKLIANTTLDATLTVAKALAFNLNGKTVTFANTLTKGIDAAEAGDLVISNGMITVAAGRTNIAYSRAIYLLHTNAAFKDLTLDLPGFEYVINKDCDLSPITACWSEPLAYTLECENVAINGNGSLFHIENANATLTDCATTIATGFESFGGAHAAAIYSSCGAFTTVDGGNFAAPNALQTGNLGGVIDVKDGTFNGNIMSFMYEGDTRYTGNTATIKIEDGTFDGQFTFAQGQAGACTKGCVTWDITGGKFSDDPTPYLTKDYEAKYDGSKWYTVAQSKGPTVAKIGDVEYDSLEAAFADAKDGEKIDLVDDYTLPASTTIEGSKAIFNLNGKTLTAGANTITFKDCETVLTNGTITFTSNYVILPDGGKIDVCCSIDNASTPQAYPISTERDGTIINIRPEARLTVVNGYGVKAKVTNGGATINVYGGYIKGWGGIQVSKAGNTSTVNIYDGEFDCSQTTLVVGDGTTDELVTVRPLDDTCKAKFKNINAYAGGSPLSKYCAPGYGLVKIGGEGEFKDYYTVQKVYNVTITEPTNGTLETSVTNKIAAGATVEVFATPASGYKVKAITYNGADITDAKSFTMPAANVTVAAEFEQASVDPETPILPPTDKTAEEYAADLNKDGGAGAAALVKAPAVVTDAGDIAAYKACFKAAVDGDYVKLVLDEEKAQTTIVPELNEAEADIVDNFDGGEISVDVIPGLYYGIAAQAEVGAIKGADAVQWVQATTANKDSFTLTVPEVKVDNVKSSKAFFQVKCTDVPATK